MNFCCDCSHFTKDTIGRYDTFYGEPGWIRIACSYRSIHSTYIYHAPKKKLCPACNSFHPRPALRIAMEKIRRERSIPFRAKAVLGKVLARVI